MKTLTVCVAAALCLAASASVYAADADKNVVISNFTDTVAPADLPAYIAGGNAFNQCLREHGVKYSEIAWKHETGNTYKYSYDMGPYSWADFDTIAAEIKPCEEVLITQANAHMQSETSSYFVVQPGMSYLPAGWRSMPSPPLLDVITYTLKPGRAAREAFVSALKKTTAASVKTKSPVYYLTMTIQAGSDGAPDYIVSIPRKNWADYGTLVNSSMRKMLEGVYGKAATDALLESFEGSIAKASEHVDSYNASLSYIAGK